MKIYISLPITGKEDTASERFSAAEKLITDLGHESVNPMELPHRHPDVWAEYILEDLQALKECDAIYMMSGWQSSNGCWTEIYFAKGCGIKIMNANVDVL